MAKSSAFVVGLFLIQLAVSQVQVDTSLEALRSQDLGILSVQRELEGTSNGQGGKRAIMHIHGHGPKGYLTIRPGTQFLVETSSSTTRYTFKSRPSRTSSRWTVQKNANNLMPPPPKDETIANSEFIGWINNANIKVRCMLYKDEEGNMHNDAFDVSAAASNRFDDYYYYDGDEYDDGYDDDYYGEYYDMSGIQWRQQKLQRIARLQRLIERELRDLQ